MAVELEQKVMHEIGLGDHYSWFNGSGSCEYIRRTAVDHLPAQLEANGLTISTAWLAKCREALRVDQVNSDRWGLTNVWIVCSYAIQDAIYRSQGGEGFSPDGHAWHFWNEAKLQQWNRMEQMRDGLRSIIIEEMRRPESL